MRRHPGFLPSLVVAGLAFGLAVPGPVHAQTANTFVTAGDLEKLKTEIARQGQVIAAQQQQIDHLKAEQDEGLAAETGRGLGAPPSGPMIAMLQPPDVETSATTPANPSSPAAQIAPVGQPPEEKAQIVAAIPPELGVLTPPGHLVIDPSVEYVRTSNNRLVFRGVEIVPGIQLGVIEASDAARDTGVATLAARYGLTNRLEVEARVPYVWRHDRITTLAQRDDTISRNIQLDGRSIGDVEFDARYQLNGGRGGWPIFVATSRLKPPTGKGPFDVGYDEFGVANELATGSGFWGAEGGITMLYPTDPAIIFGGLTYLHNFSRDIDKDVGGVHIGRVWPGDSIGATVGFGLSLNPRFSVSLGYSHSVITRTKSQYGDTTQSSQPLQVGNLLMGWSFRLSDRLTLNNSFEFGVTSDAPDLRVVLRAPYRF
jgi:hypothetical protein